YVRRSRRRFWKGEDDSDKKAAHSTLYECLVTVTKLTAPFTPFVAEKLYQNLVRNVDANAPKSVHSARWPDADDFPVNTELSWQMAYARRIVAMGRTARNTSAVKTRQPLREVIIVLGSDAIALDESSQGHIKQGIESLKEIVLDELNVKGLRFGSTEDVTAYSLKPNLGVVGPKYGRLAPELRRMLAEASPETGAKAAAGEDIAVNVEGREIILSTGELLIEPTERPGYALEREQDLAVALATELDEELVDEGLVRELVHKVQSLRREEGFEIEDAISVTLSGSERITALLSGGWGEYFKAEVLARSLTFGSPDRESFTVEGEKIGVELNKIA
ncbi:MAG: DUF5915 domain-containing protein, partial [Rubrobacter sp.]